MRCAARRRPNIRTGSWLRRKARSSTRWARPSEARKLYRKALDLKPNDPSVLSNLGMSYVLEGDLKTAETYMRSASEQPGADSRVRQNLALVVGLQGRFEEAEQIASHELSAGAGAGQRRLSALDAVAAERLEPAQGRRQEETAQHQLG